MRKPMLRSLQASRTFSLLLTLVFASSSVSTGQTEKPVLHGRHWMAITGKPLGAMAGAFGRHVGVLIPAGDGADRFEQAEFAEVANQIAISRFVLHEYTRRVCILIVVAYDSNRVWLHAITRLESYATTITTRYDRE